MNKSSFWTAVICIGLAACSGRHANLVVPGADLIDGEDLATAASGVAVTLSPAQLRTCEHPDGRMVVTISWDVRASGAIGVTIWVSDPSDAKEKRFFQGGPVGSAETGPWAADGLVFRIEDSNKKGRTLATRTLHSVVCLVEPSSSQATHE